MCLVREEVQTVALCYLKSTYHHTSPPLRRRLLAQVCLVREEVQNVARTAAFGRGDSWTPTSDKTAQLRGGVPRRAVAFLQVPPESGILLAAGRPVALKHSIPAAGNAKRHVCSGACWVLQAGVS